LVKSIRSRVARFYPAPGRSWIFRASSTDAEAVGYWKFYKYYYRVYINPYTGQVLKVEDTRNEFFQLVLNLHMNLLLGDKVGGMITGVCTLCFFVILISGLILWWPAKWKAKALKNKLTIKSGTSAKRFNYDLHNISGFYLLIPLLLICITGLVFAFPWADDTVQYVANGAKVLEKRKIPLSTPNDGYTPAAIDYAVVSLIKTHAKADVFSIRFRNKDTDPLDVQVRLAEKRTHLFEWYYFDRNTGKLLLKYGDNDVQGGEKFRSMNYDLHTGAYAGIFTKILYLLISLFCTSLPVTGFLIWYNRGSKSKKKARASVR
jgi:uncharacterized iron-regulated membrane protein